MGFRACEHKIGDGERNQHESIDEEHAIPQHKNVAENYGSRSLVCPRSFVLSGCHDGKPDSFQQVLETSMIPESVHGGIQVKVYEPVAVLFVGFFEVFDRAVVIAQADVDSSEEVGRSIFLFCSVR